MMIDFKAVSEIVREEIRSDYVPNACILAARLTTLALREFGVPCEAVACAVDAFSPAYVQMSQRAMALGREPTEAEVAEYAARGAWRVELNFDPAPPGVLDRRNDTGYHAHVVTLAAGRGWLLDPTLAQVNRPEKGLRIEPPYAFEVEPEEIEARHIAMPLPGGSALSYRLIFGRRDFIKAPDWNPVERRRKATFERVLGRIIERIEETNDHRGDAHPDPGQGRLGARDRALAPVPAPHPEQR